MTGAAQQKAPGSVTPLHGTPEGGAVPLGASVFPGAFPGGAPASTPAAAPAAKPAAAPPPASAASPPSRGWSARSTLVIGFLTTFLLVGGFGSWSVLAEIRGAIIASGRIEVDQNRQVVQHPDGGVVTEILVKEGDTVGAGDVLIRLDRTEIASQLAVVEGQLFELLARRARLEAERDGVDALNVAQVERMTGIAIPPELLEGQERLFRARLVSAEQQKDQLSKQRDQVADQIDGIRAQQEAVRIQLDIVTEELVDQQGLLDQGLAQSSRVLQLQREAANLTGQAGELTATVAQAEAKITEIDIQILQIDSMRREESISLLRDQQFNEIELSEQRRSLLTRLERLELRAPVSGVIYGMQVFAERSVIRPADPVLFLIPQDRPLVITAQIQTINIDQVFVSQSVALRFSAFDQRRTPELDGRVIQVSADAFTDEASGLSFYRAQIELLPGELEKLPEDMVLLPGMPVEAFFRTTERTPMGYLLKPLTDYFAKVFVET